MKTVEVVIGQQLVGHAYFTRQRGRISTTFVYDPAYLASSANSIDPALLLVSGTQYQSGLFGAFADSAPDRWGRNLIEKVERVRAREEKRTPCHLDDVDFLLGVSDDTRQGALRYRNPGQSSFLGQPSIVPRLISLPELLRASDELGLQEDSASAVKQLLDTGTTGLGGARPKASVQLEDGSLAIAKFPHANDSWDVMAWEATALDLLEASGIRTPKRRLTRVGDRSVLILQRFDRSAMRQRIGYISAMTATGSVDGEQRDYSDIAEVMRDLSQVLERDHHELFSRVVASVAIGNTDDHLRNHGFLAAKGAWTLSPAFDVNPNPDLDRSRSTSIMGADTFPDEISGILALADDCGLSQTKARDTMGQIVHAMTEWKQLARANGINEREITMMSESIEPRIQAIKNATLN